MESFKKAYIALALLFTIIIVGVTGFMTIEGFCFTDAFFMTIITIATVGFNTVHPLSPTGMWFTAFLIIFSFGIFAYAVTTFTRYAVDGVFRNYYRTNRVKNKIKLLKNHVIICGYGRNGRQAAQELMSHDVPVVIVEREEHALQQLQENPDILYIHGDSTRDEVLDQCNVEQAKALITTMPVDSDNLFVVLTAREKNPKMAIISRASEDSSNSRLKRAGATNVIMPDKIGGQRMAKLVAQPDIVEFLEFLMLQSSENQLIDEISCYNLANHFNEKSIRELESANDSGANIVGMRRDDGSFVINPLAEILLVPSDKIFVLGTKRQIARLKKIIAGQD
jgi:voltage-gated potassium channel